MSEISEVIQEAGLTLTDGFADSSTFDGGAVRTGAGTALTVLNSTIKDSFAFSHGGAIDSGGALTVVNSTFSNNRADGFGGGVYVRPGTSASL